MHNKKRFAESDDYEKPKIKRAKIYDEMEDAEIPMEFGSRRFNKSTEDVDVYTSKHRQKQEQDNFLPSQGKDVTEQRINVQDLYKMEQQQEEEYKSWKEKEELFEFEQAILRSKIRLENNRDKPIDK